MVPLGLVEYSIVFVQTDDDEAAYKARFAGTPIRFQRAPEKGFAEVNHYLEHFFDVGTQVVVMHDDLTSILKLEVAVGHAPSFKPLADKAAAEAMLDLAFSSLKKHGLKLGGVNTTQNALWASSSAAAVSLDLKFIYDPLHFFISTKDTPKCVFKYFDDVERTIYAYKRDGGVVRLNHFAMGTKHEPFNPKVVGGLAGERTREGAEEAAKRFEMEFKDYTNPFRRGAGGALRVNLKRLPFQPSLCRAWEVRALGKSADPAAGKHLACPRERGRKRSADAVLSPRGNLLKR